MLTRVLMRTTVSLCLAVLLCSADPVSAASLTLVETGGTMGPHNLALGGDAFAGGQLGYGIHFVHHLNDGVYGNSNSWIGSDGSAPIAGIGFDAGKIVGGIAWGRDNTNTYDDRWQGSYQVQYTTAPNPDETTPDGAWTTIGSITYDATTPDAQGWIRHRSDFDAVSATGIRLVVPGTGLSGGTCIDELELYTGLLMAEEGGTMGALNIAPNGTAFAENVISGYAIHQIPHLNDGLYGNDQSWIAGSTSSFAGIDLEGSFLIDAIAWGRDNTDTYDDRSKGTYTVQYTTMPDPDASTSDADWITLGSVTYDDGWPGDVGVRHLFDFEAVQATGVRVLTDAEGSWIGIDELEVYTVPEPLTLTLLGGGFFGLLGRRFSGR